MKIAAQAKQSYLYLVKWVCIAVVSGVVCTPLVRSFFFLMQTISSFLTTINVPLPLWTLAGALVAGAVIYRIQPQAAGEGIPSYLRGLRIHKGDLLFSVTFFKYWAGLVTLSTFGNGGVVGPIGRVSAGVMSRIFKFLIKRGFTQEDQRTASICGLAAAIGTIFHSSIGGGIFAVEIIQRAKMGYKDLFPSILASSTAVFLCKAVGWDSFYRFKVVSRFMDITMIGWLVLLCVLTGLTGGLYTNMYAKTTKIIKRKEGNVVLKVIAGSLVAAWLAWLVNPHLLGTSTNLVTAIMEGNLFKLEGRIGMVPWVPLILLVLMFSKMIANCITVGAGMSAGFTGPAIIVGMLLGAAMAHLLDAQSDAATYYAFVAAGFAGSLASTMNVPLAAAVMTTEIFGLTYSFPAALAAVLGFQITRHHTLYDYALAGAGLDLDKE